MTLRLRLVLAVLAVVTVALGVFFSVTYLEYRDSEYQRLYAQLRAAEPTVDHYLESELGQGGPPGGSGQGGFQPGGDGPQRVEPPQYFGQKRNSAGILIASVFPYQSSSGPNLPTVLPTPAGGSRFFTSGNYMVLDTVDPDESGTTIIVAVPTTEVTNAVDRLVLIEGAGIAGLLIVVAAGAWLVVRRGLRPLERMAGTASLISGGDLSQRVTLANNTSEVGQLGLALNTMLDDIEAAFAERDATEQKLRQFLADASHELRTPLTSIQGFAELFRLHGEEAKVDLPTILRRIEEESARMKVLVEDLLLLARLDQHREVERKPTDLVVLAADACADAVATDPQRAVTLDASEPLVVEGDEVHLRQALGNLVSNALRHTPAGTPLEVGCRREGNEAVISVRDHGPGLDEASLTHVFDRFWQGDKARVGTGAGLGLSIVAAIAAEHGGRAEAVNAPGGGAEFRLILPAAVKATVPV